MIRMLVREQDRADILRRHIRLLQTAYQGLGREAIIHQNRRGAVPHEYGVAATPAAQ
jgi:hypothetical protein